jgi:hypothetical protein
LRKGSAINNIPGAGSIIFQFKINIVSRPFLLKIDIGLTGTCV